MAQFKPTLAVNADEATIRRLLSRGHLLASPKLDGIRAMRRGGELVSRSLKPTPNRHIRACLDHPGLEGFDGELIVGSPRGDGVFRRSTSGVSRESGEPDFRWHVFDLTDVDGGFDRRHELLVARHSVLPDGVRARVVVVEQVRVGSLESLQMYEARCVEVGYEGVMLRRPDAPYKRGRSTLNEAYLLKVKRFEDAEGVVVGFEERMHNSNAATTSLLGGTERSHRQEGMVPCGDLGALRLRDPSGRWAEFGVGSGFDAAERVELWRDRESLLGRVVKYRFQPVGSDEKPRQPIFHGFRDPGDL